MKTLLSAALTVLFLSTQAQAATKAALQPTRSEDRDSTRQQEKRSGADQDVETRRFDPRFDRQQAAIGAAMSDLVVPEGHSLKTRSVQVVDKDPTGSLTHPITGGQTVQVKVKTSLGNANLWQRIGYRLSGQASRTYNVSVDGEGRASVMNPIGVKTGGFGHFLNKHAPTIIAAETGFLTGLLAPVHPALAVVTGSAMVASAITAGHQFSARQGAMAETRTWALNREAQPSLEFTYAHYLGELKARSKSAEPETFKEFRKKLFNEKL